MDAATDNLPSPKAGCARCSKSFFWLYGRGILRNELRGAGIAHDWVSPWFLMALRHSFLQSCRRARLPVVLLVISWKKNLGIFMVLDFEW